MVTQFPQIPPCQLCTRSSESSGSAPVLHAPSCDADIRQEIDASHSRSLSEQIFLSFLASLITPPSVPSSNRFFFYSFFFFSLFMLRLEWESCGRWDPGIHHPELLSWPAIASTICVWRIEQALMLPRPDAVTLTGQPLATGSHRSVLLFATKPLLPRNLNPVRQLAVSRSEENSVCKNVGHRRTLGWAVTSTAASHQQRKSLQLIAAGPGKDPDWWSRGALASHLHLCAASI